MGTAIKHPVPDRITGYAVICNFGHPDTLALTAERQSARMSNITNDGLTRSGTGCFIAVHTDMATVGVKGLSITYSIVAMVVHLYCRVWNGMTNSTDAVMHEQIAHYTIDHRPQLTQQWNKCVKHCLEWNSSLPLTYPTLHSGLTYTKIQLLLFF